MSQPPSRSAPESSEQLASGHQNVSPQRIRERAGLLTGSGYLLQSDVMVRIAIVVACGLLAAACGKDVEDPGFTATASASTTAGTSSGSSSGGEESSSGSASATGNSNSSTNATTATTEPADSSGEGTTGPADSGGPAGCGDGTISPGEQCDGADLQGFDCNSLGLNGGTLSCDPVTCTFDTSMCMSTSGGTSG